jgi:hypothetical protein
VIAALRLDQKFEVIYRSSEDGQKHQFSAARSDNRVGVWLANLTDLPAKQACNRA